MSDFQIRDKDGERGPFTIGQLRSMWDNGILTSATEARLDGNEWVQLSIIIEGSEPAMSSPGDGKGDESDVLRAVVYRVAGPPLRIKLRVVLPQRRKTELNRVPLSCGYKFAGRRE